MCAADTRSRSPTHPPAQRPSDPPQRPSPHPAGYWPQPTARRRPRPHPGPRTRRTGSPSIHRHRQRRTHRAHPIISQPTQPRRERRHRHTLHQIQIHRRALRHRIIIGLQDHFTGEPPHRRRARRHQHPPQPRNRHIARQHHHRPRLRLGGLAPPQLPARGQRHRRPADSRQAATSPHWSGSSAGCSS